MLAPRLLIPGKKLFRNQIPVERSDQEDQRSSTKQNATRGYTTTPPHIGLYRPTEKTYYRPPQHQARAYSSEAPPPMSNRPEYMSIANGILHTTSQRLFREAQALMLPVNELGKQIIYTRQAKAIAEIVVSPLAAIPAAIVSTLATHPLETILTTCQAKGVSAFKAFESVTNQQKNYLNLYNGIRPPLVATVFQRMAQFGAYNAILNPTEFHLRQLLGKPLDDRTESDCQTSPRFKSYHFATKFTAAVISSLVDSAVMVFSEYKKIPLQLGLPVPSLNPLSAQGRANLTQQLPRVFTFLAARDCLSGIAGLCIGGTIKDYAMDYFKENDIQLTNTQQLGVSIGSVATAIFSVQSLAIIFDNLKSASAAEPHIPVTTLVKNMAYCREFKRIAEQVESYGGSSLRRHVMGSNKLDRLPERVLMGKRFLAVKGLNHDEIRESLRGTHPTSTGSKPLLSAGKSIGMQMQNTLTHISKNKLGRFAVPFLVGEFFLRATSGLAIRKVMAPLKVGGAIGLAMFGADYAKDKLNEAYKGVLMDDQAVVPSASK